MPEAENKIFRVKTGLFSFPVPASGAVNGKVYNLLH